MREFPKIVSMRGLQIVLLFPALVIGALQTGARAQTAAPGAANIDEKLGARVALDSVLNDEDGNHVTLRELIHRPTILTLNYFTCTGICTPLLNGLVDTLNQLDLEPWKDYQVITISFDPDDTPEIAHEKRINYLKQMTRPFPPEAWRFLTGSAAGTKAVTDSVGFIFQKTDSGFLHPGAIIMLTPAGIVSRYMYGISFLPADVEMAIREASAGQVRPTISKVLAFCYSYDPAGRRYVFSMTRALGALTLAFAGGWVLYLVLAGRSRKRKEKERLSA
jgi:protein SCO1/2